MYLLRPRGELTKLANATAQPSRVQLKLKSCAFHEQMHVFMLLSDAFGRCISVKRK